MENKIRKSIARKEKSHLGNLNEYRVLNTKPANGFDELAIYTATIFNTSVALINFVDQDFAWVKSDLSTGTASGADDKTSLCTVAIAKSRQTLFKQLSAAPILISNAMIAGEFGMKFYAAAPIINDAGIHVGSICLADERQRPFSPKDQAKLEQIGVMVRKEMNNRIDQKHTYSEGAKP